MQPVGPRLRRLDGFLGIGQRGAVVGAKNEYPDGVGAVFFQGVPYGYQVTQALAHLFLAHAEQAVVHPVLHEGFLAGKCFRLGDLVFVMGKDDVLAAAVDVNPVAEELAGHGAALDVPARPAFSPGAVPGRLAGLRLFPEDEVHRVFLGLGGLDPRAGHHLVGAAPGQLAVIDHFSDSKKDVAADRIPVAFIDKALRHGDDFRYGLGGFGGEVRAQVIERVHVLEVPGGVLFRELFHRDSEAVGVVDDIVLDVGDVFHVPDFIAAELQVPPHDIEEDIAQGVPDMRVAVGVDAADVHRDHIAERFEFFFLPG